MVTFRNVGNNAAQLKSHKKRFFVVFFLNHLLAFLTCPRENRLDRINRMFGSWLGELQRAAL